MTTEINPTLMFVMQGLLAVLMAFFVFLMNGMRLAMKEIRDDLKTLNDAVLGKYVTIDATNRWRELHIKEESERWTVHLQEEIRAAIEQRRTDHELRNEIQVIKVTLATLQAKGELK